MAVILLAAVSCSIQDSDEEGVLSKPIGPVKVGFYAGKEQNIGITTKSVAGPDGLSTTWTEGDKVALWAFDSDGNAALSAEPFKHYGHGFFTTELPSQMEEETYTYYAAYPVPVSGSGLTATFLVPSGQDGVSGGGEDIMVSFPAGGGALSPIDWLEFGHDEPELEMRHLLHRLRFYTDASEAFGGEKIRRIEVDFPKAVAGPISLELDNPSVLNSAMAEDTRITIATESPLEFSSDAQRHYATASIIPTTFGDGQSMQVAMYTMSKKGTVTIPLRSRTFAAGHSTPVKLVPSYVSTYCSFNFTIASNNLGEPVQKVTLSAPAGCKWGDNGAETYVYEPGHDLDAGDGFVVEYADEQAFRTLSGKTVELTYDSEHVTISESITIPDLSSSYSASLALNVPYLLFEDFSAVPTFSSNDEYSDTFVTGDKNPYSFLNGWTGGRVGALEGYSIRIACRRETSAKYDARVDSAPLKGKLKKTADIKVEFDYGANNQFSTGLLSDPDVGQTCYVGYVTSTAGYSSGDKTGTFPYTFHVHEKSGSYYNTPNHAVYVLSGIPVNDVIRMSWRTLIDNNAGLTNTTDWLYLDNIKVTISK